MSHAQRPNFANNYARDINESTDIVMVRTQQLVKKLGLQAPAVAGKKRKHETPIQGPTRPINYPGERKVWKRTMGPFHSLICRPYVLPYRYLFSIIEKAQTLSAFWAMRSFDSDGTGLCNKLLQ